MRKKYKIYYLFLFLILIILFLSFKTFSKEVISVTLELGKNYIVFNTSSPFYVKTLIKLNPSIEVVSYKENNQTIGYVNYLGGIGDNFLISGEKEYEIYVSEKTNLIIPYN